MLDFITVNSVSNVMELSVHREARHAGVTKRRGRGGGEKGGRRHFLVYLPPRCKDYMSEKLLSSFTFASFNDFS